MKLLISSRPSSPPKVGAGARPSPAAARASWRNRTSRAMDAADRVGLDPMSDPINERGVALVVTLILLAVITTLAIAFVALTHRETAAVSAVASTTDAENAAEQALARAKAEILARFIMGNGFEVAGPGLMVSLAADTNRFEPDPPGPSGAYRDPSPPVFINTNTPGLNGPLDERFSIDLNRNKNHDETGLVPVTMDDYSAYVDPGTGLVATNWVVGDPMWVGLLLNAFRITGHTNDNPYVARYAWLVMPIGQSLDINAIHNQAINVDMRSGNNGYYRNQGIAPWESNLGAFLTDLNTNAWPASANQYQFRPLSYGGALAPVAFGVAFNDAREILSYRYTPVNYAVRFPSVVPNSPQAYLDAAVDGANQNYSLFTSAGAAFGSITPDQRIGVDGLDYYTVRPIGDTGDYDAPANPWSGARNKRNYYNLPQDLWDERKLPDPNGIRTRLAAASAMGNSYDRYTYYRLLEQMGTDSLPDDDRINVNYVNVRSWTDPAYRMQSSDMVSWNTRSQAFKDQMGRTGPELFFLSAVRKMFLQDTNFATFVTPSNSLPDRPLRIPVYTNNSSFYRRLFAGAFVTNSLYSGRVHQILQQAANIYDATRDIEANEYPGQRAGQFPTIFRPRFEVEGNDVFIVDYAMIDGDAPPQFMSLNVAGKKWHDLELGEKPTAGGISDDMIYNIPMVVGARKGFPSLNEFATKTSVMATRRLDAYKNAGETEINNFRFTESLDLNITNEFGFEAWNSYLSNTYPRPLSLFFSNRVIAEIRRDNTLVRTIDVGEGVLPPRMTMAANTWRGPRTINELTLGYQATNFPGRVLFGWTNVAPVTASGPDHNWTVTVRNQMRFFLVDQTANRLVDAVGWSVTNQFFNVGAQLSKDLDDKTAGAAVSIWSQGAAGGRNWRRGIEQQLNISRGRPAVDRTVWENYSPTSPNKDGGEAAFNSFITNLVLTTARVPFTPSRLMVQTNFWRAKDPLVHYLPEDMWRTNGGSSVGDAKPRAQPRLGLGEKNPEYVTWANIRDPLVRDPGVQSSDAWNFPTNKVPTVGYLGRVHRGTPWQTVYFKSDGAALPAWREQNNSSRALDTTLAMHPTNDWRLVDVFTASGHPNAARGRLSINQTNIAAWSAVLTGLSVGVATNVPDTDVTVFGTVTNVVPPAALSDPASPDSYTVQAVVDGIMTIRTNRQFRRLSEFLAVPELTMRSPLLTVNGYNPRNPPDDHGRMLDSEYEGIPEKILGLVKAGEPRYVIYSWGQSLKPAEFGVARVNGKLMPSGPAVETSGDNRGMPKNYQITGEYATRAVVRIEFDRMSNDPTSPLFHEFNYARPRAVVESFNILPPD